MATPIDSVRSSVFASQPAASGRSSSSPGGMSINDFYKLLAAQLKYQDADNPMDTSEMMAQMVQTQMIGAITQMSQVNTITYAASMVGKEVEMAEIDDYGRFTGDFTKGVISGMLMGDNPILYIGEKGYFMSQIMTIGEVPKAEEDPADPSDPSDPSDPGGPS